MRLLSYLTGIALLATPVYASAAQQSFTDIPANHGAFAAAEYLKSHGILQGYDDGTFRPEQAVNRAEVIKLIVMLRVEADEITSASGALSFRDVPGDAWFSPYVQQAYTTLRIIDGPPSTYTFAPTRTVTRAEFLKMLLLAYNTDPMSSYGEISAPLADDVNSPSEWYYSYVRYALTASMLIAEDGSLEPGKQLTRGDIAETLYRFLLYREGKQTQTLLSMTENETLTALRMLENSAIDSAERAAARALLASRGALTSQPQDATVKSAVKTAEAVTSLVQGSAMLLQGDSPKAVDRASTAWHLGEKAKSFSSVFDPLVTQIQTMATEMAGRARGN